ncbi:MAG: hypothetical protein AAFV53_23260 [Myxococcota bacterium]
MSQPPTPPAHAEDHWPHGPPSSSRTLQTVKWGLWAQVLPSIALVIAVGAAAAGQDVPPYTMLAVAMLSVSIATTATGGAVAHGARHWGAREPSSAWGGALSLWQGMREAAGPQSPMAQYPSPATYPPQDAHEPAGHGPYTGESP